MSIITCLYSTKPTLLVFFSLTVVYIQVYTGIREGKREENVEKGKRERLILIVAKRFSWPKNILRMCVEFLSI